MSRTRAADPELPIADLPAPCANGSPQEDEPEGQRAPSRIQQAIRWWYVLRYHHISQLAMRLLIRGRRRLLALTGEPRYVRPPRTLPRLRENRGLGSLLQWKVAGRAPGDSASNAQRIAGGSYRFLNEERALPDPVDWRLDGCREVSHLWRFHLHDHEFLLDLIAEGLNRGEETRFKRAWDLVSQWIQRNHLSDPRVLVDAWHPYCISRRLPVWILLWSACPPNGELGDRVLRSIFAQTSFLERHLEWDVRGNHLLENARGLVLAGAFLDCPQGDRWLATGAGILRKELAAQILSHGEHFERSPMYHAQMLEAVLDVRDAVSTLMPELAELCQGVSAEMATFLSAILHPDGEIPLLGDACLGQTAPPGHLTSRAAGGSSQPVSSLPCEPQAPVGPPSGRIVGDYWIYRHNADFILFDAGPVGPDHLPAHAHADLLSFEASLHGQRLIVDSGVFCYQDDAMRRHCRSTAAHNVLQIDEHDQCDMWSRFRMGFRGWPSGLEHGEAHGFHWARATHNAYRRFGVPRVGRWMACRPGGPWLCVDWAEGKDRHELSSWLHFHPGVDVQKVADDELRLSVNNTDLRLRYLTPGKIRVTTGWYCPEFGCRLKCPVAQWTSEETLPSICGWYLVWDERDGAAVLNRADSGTTLLHWCSQDEQVQLDPIERLFST